MKNYALATLLFVFLLSFLASCQKEVAVTDSHLIAINQPYRNEIAYIGSDLTIKWQSNCVSFVTIELYRENKLVTVLAENLLNENTYIWHISNEIHAGNGYYIKIINTSDEKNFIMPESPLTIRKTDIKSEFIDVRDGKRYPTIKIGDQVWMAENFNYELPDESFCYGDQPDYCNISGRLYSLTGAAKSAPAGWHLPSDTEWKELEAFLGIPHEELNLTGKRGVFSGHLLKLNGGCGFNTITGGYRNFCANRYGHRTYESHFWTSSKDNNGKPIVRVIDIKKGDIARITTICHEAASVRYIKDK